VYAYLICIHLQKGTHLLPSQRLHQSMVEPAAAPILAG
jgi:hypothetical protein